jgi:glycosyltransferase involved in cell wall biosynthesis
MKVLLSAFACGPDQGSEPGIGWNWVRQIGRKHEVWLLTVDAYRGEMERGVPANVHVIYVPSHRLYAWLLTRGVRGVDWVYYYWWQVKVYRIARRLQRKIGFDLAHHVTFGSWRTPSLLCLLPIPLIWGPVGGGETVPGPLRAEMGWKGRVFEGVREICQHVSQWDPFVRLTMRRATTILAANRDTAAIIPARYQAKVRTFPNIGMHASEQIEPALHGDKETAGFLVLLAGMLEPRKGVSLALKAFERLVRSRADATLLVIGKGRERARLAALAARLGLGDRVRFLGSLPRAQVLGRMQAADALLHPSLRDSGGVVLLEAMMAGKPVVCLDLGGPGEIITDECGFKVRAGDPDQVVSDLAAALEKLAADPALRQRMGEAGRRRVWERFDWDKRGEEMMELYRQVCASRHGPQNNPRA